ncbi:hypothetical protein Bca4012_049643 [Brassica carinata]|uniref:Uncharacterized protein n=1 Tax=Brassica oleracea TaxID=3712 RepID=A0A3P6DDA2_BRAOL|nr:unnamed protein product [Brassica oleracea]
MPITLSFSLSLFLYQPVTIVRDSERCTKTCTMVKEGLAAVAADNGEGINILLYIWAAVLALSIRAAVTFTCSDGASKSQTDDVHGSACAAGCGGGCGG